MSKNIFFLHNLICYIQSKCTFSKLLQCFTIFPYFKGDVFAAKVCFLFAEICLLNNQVLIIYLYLVQYLNHKNIIIF